jgi:hypothetical protein
MDFISVDCIRLAYQYGENTVRKASLSLGLDSYIDESTRKFYILQKYEKYESRHIDTMVNYLILDESARLKLSQYIRHLFKIYQDEGIQVLTKQQEGLSEQKVPKWVIPQVSKKVSNSLLEVENEEDENEMNDELFIVPSEMLEKMKNEPGWELPKPNTSTITDPNQPKLLTCYPPKAGAVDIIESRDVKHPSKSKLQVSDAIKNTEATSVTSQSTVQNNSNSSISTSSSSVSKTNDGIDQTTDTKNGRQVIPNESGKLIDGKTKYSSFFEYAN